MTEYEAHRKLIRYLDIPSGRPYPPLDRNLCERAVKKLYASRFEAGIINMLVTEYRETHQVYPGDLMFAPVEDVVMILAQAIDWVEEEK